MTLSKDCAGAAAPARFLCIAEAWIAEKVTIESPELEAPALTDVSDAEVTPTTTPVVPTEAVVTPNSAPVVLTAPTEPETSTEPEETTESTEPVEMPASIKSVAAWQWVDELEIIDLELNVATIPGISAGGTLPDGTEISVSGAPAGAKWLVVRKIGQEEGPSPTSGTPLGGTREASCRPMRYTSSPLTDSASRQYGEHPGILRDHGQHQCTA